MGFRACSAASLLALLTAASGAPARAETSKPFTVGATIASGCVVSTHTGGGGTWGAINLGSAPGLTAQNVSASLVSNGQSGLQLACTPGTTANVTADQGLHSAGGFRNLAHASQAGSQIRYQLYANNSATPWTTQAVAVSFGAGVQAQSLPVTAVASIPGPIASGGYADTVQVTVSW